MPSLSHRSSLLFRRHSATSLVTDSDIETEEISSPSKLDPFQSKPTYPLPTVRERPSRPERPSTPTRKAKGLSRKQTLLESKSTPTPKIVLASPSTSTIHYLFPADNSSSHLTAIPFDSRLPRYTGTSSSSVSGSDVSRQRLSRRSLETYDYAPIIESGSSRRLSKPVVRVAPKHSPRDSLDYTKGLKTRLDPDGSGRTNGLKDLGRGYPASTRVTPTTITVLGPTKRVPSLGTEPAPKRESIGTRLKLATTTPVAHAPATTSVSLRTISPISNPAAPGIIKKAQSMRTLRRQRSLADLERKVKKVDMARMPALMERENHVEIPTFARPVDARKRSQSLSSDRQPRPSPIVTAPTTPAVLSPAPGSPVLPPPDLGDPLMVTIPNSPSFSHLDYSTAGSSAPCRRNSTTPSFSKSRQALYPASRRDPDAIFTNRDAQSPSRTQVPVSASMSRGTTRHGLGGYDRAKQVARDDLEKRLAARDEERGRTLEKLTGGQSTSERSTTISRPRRFSLRRSQSLKRPVQAKETGRIRSQSLSAKTVRLIGSSPPVPLPEAGAKERPKSEAGRGIYLGDLNVDLGGRFLLEASLFPGSDTDKRPQSSLYPDTTPSSGYSSLPQSTVPDSSFPNTANPPQGEFPYSRHSLKERKDSIRSGRYRGRPLHPAFASSTSLLAPSTIGLGFSPIATPVSLPESLMDEAIDLTAGGWKMSERSGSMEDITITLRDSPFAQPNAEADPGPSRVNQFFLPPLYPNSLRMTKSLGPGVLRSSYVAKAGTPPRPARSPSRGPPTPKEDRSDPLKISTTCSVVNDDSAPAPRKTPKTPRGTGRTVPMPSSFSLCSPPDAIDPLPALQPVSASTRQLRNNKSASFLSASASLRGLFKRDRAAQVSEGGTLASRITTVDAATVNTQEVKYRGRIISSPMDLDPPPPVDQKPTESYGALGHGPRKPRSPSTLSHDEEQEKDRARRERILSAALSQSLRAKRDVTPISTREVDKVRAIVPGTSRSRMAIPTALLAPAPINDVPGEEEPHRPLPFEPRSIGAPVSQLHPSPDLVADPSSPPRHPRPFSPHISKWSPSPIKPKRRRLKALVGSPSLPSLSLPLHTARSMISLHKAKDSITLSFSKDSSDRTTGKDAPEHELKAYPDDHVGSSKVVYDSPRRSLSAERDRQVIARDLRSPDRPSPLDVFSSPPDHPRRPGTPRRIRGSTLPSGLSLTPRSQTRNPHASTMPTPGRSGKWWTSTGMADRARRFFSPELGSEGTASRRSYTSKPGHDVFPTTGPVSWTDPPIRKVLEELIQREEYERARANTPDLEHGDDGHDQDAPDEVERASSEDGAEIVEAPKVEGKWQSRSLSSCSSRVDRAQKVLDWCEAVDGTKDLREMEERWRAHVEEEKERIRRIGERKVPLSVGI